jgi:hypothetical protein
MTDIRKWINLVESTRQERRFYLNQANEFRKERAKWWPVSPELMASYDDGSHTKKEINGSLEWYKNGLKHRDFDKPALIFANGSLAWCKNGDFHRDDDKPAVIWWDGSLWWDKNGLSHRDGDKPAWIGANGILRWYKNHLQHRVLGPAVIDEKNKFEWWFKGEQIPVTSQDEYEEWLKKNRPFDPEVRQLYQLR